MEGREAGVTVIRRELARLRRALRVSLVLGGVMRLLLLILLSLAGWLGIHWFLAPGKEAGQGLGLTLLFLWVGASWWLLGRPAMRRISLTALARWLEGRVPELEERISTALQLSEGKGTGVNQETLGWICEEAERELGARSLREEARVGQVGRLKGGFLGALLLMGASFGLVGWFFPEELRQTLRAGLNPGGELGSARAGEVQVWPGAVELFEGQELVVKASFTDGGRENEKPARVLIFRDEAGEPGERALRLSGRHGETQIPVRPGRFRYQVVQGVVRSPRYPVKVKPRPQLESLMARLTFPDFSGWEAVEVTVGTQLEALQGTRASLTGVLNQELEEIMVEEGGRTERLTVNGDAFTTEVSFAARPNQIQDQEEKRVTLLSALPKPGGQVLRQLELTARPDQKPEVIKIWPPLKKVEVKPAGELALEFALTDDVGVEEARLLILQEEAEIESVPVSKVKVMRPSAPGVAYQGRVALSLNRDLIPAAQWERGEFLVCLQALEAGPGKSGRSEPLTVRVREEAPMLARQIILARKQGFREGVEAGKAELREAWHESQRLHASLHQESLESKEHGQVRQADRRLVEAVILLKEQMRAAEDPVLAHLRQDLENSVQHARKARRQLQRVVMEERGKRQKALNQAQAATQAGITQLNQLLRKLDAGKRGRRDFSVVQDLIEQQEEKAKGVGEAPTAETDESAGSRATEAVASAEGDGEQEERMGERESAGSPGSSSSSLEAGSGQDVLTYGEVPPELAKLGVSLAEWWELRQRFASPGIREEENLPETYRRVTRDYFKTLGNQ